MNVLLILAALAATAATGAGPTPEQADARCLDAFALMAAGGDPAKPDPKMIEAGKTGATYFVGKLRGRNPAVDLEAVMRAGFPAVQADAEGEVKRCGAELTDAGQAMKKAGAALQAEP